MTEEVPNVSTPLAQEDQPATVTIDGPSTSIVRRTPVPRELEALGVKIAVDPESDMQILIIPEALSQRANVLRPEQSFQQADPNWRPSLRIIQLDPSPDGAHFYKQQGKLAPRKQALELLADAAGVIDKHIQLLGRERLIVGDMQAETFTHLATVKVRKSDGTVSVLQASRTYEPYVEYEELKASPNTKGPADLRKKWLNEIKFAKAKNESKAMNRALRSVLQISHTYTQERAAKPFAVIGWNLSPQNTPEVRAEIARLYGAAPEQIEQHVPSSHDWDPPELAEGEVVLEDDAGSLGAPASDQQAAEVSEPPSDTPAAPGVEDSPTPEQAPTPPAPDGDGETGTAAQGVAPSPTLPESPAAASDGPTREPETTPSSGLAVGAGDEAPEVSPNPPPAPPPTEPQIPGVTPTADPESETADPATLARALEVKIPQGSYQGRTIGWLLELGEPANEYLAYALRQPWPHDQPFLGALRYALRAHRPEMYAAWRDEA